MLYLEAFPIWASILISFIIVTLIALVVSFFTLKKIKLEQDLNDNWWKIGYDEILFPNVQANKSAAGHKSALSLTMSETEGYQSGKTSSLRTGSVGHSLVSAAGVIDSVFVGVYKGIKIAFKPLNIKKLFINRQLLVEIKLVNLKSTNDIIFNHLNLLDARIDSRESGSFCWNLSR